MHRSVIQLAVCLFVVGVFLFLNAQMFMVEHLEWTGLIYLDEAQLMTYVGFESQNILRLNTRALAAQLKDHPWIQDAIVRRSWPNEVRLEIRERRPLAIIPIDDSWFLLDDQGVLMPPPSGEYAYPLPLVSNVDLESAEAMRATARIMLAVPAKLRETISEWNSELRVLVTRQGTRVLVGELKDLEVKFELLDVILDDLTQRGLQAEHIDLRTPKNPVVVTR